MLVFEVRYWSHLLKRMKLLKCLNQHQQVTLLTQKMNFHSHFFLGQEVKFTAGVNQQGAFPVGGPLPIYTSKGCGPGRLR